MSDRPGLDPSKPDFATTGGDRFPPKMDPHPNELAELAARFASRANGGLSEELSAELALEILLNEIAEQACAATGATGAAIALQRDGEMVCRATSGTTAPDLGSRVDLMSGLSGKCVQTQQTQRCEDVMNHPEADVAASERLGVRSVIVMPLLNGAELIGVFELFSSLPFAFGQKDEGILYGFAQRVLNNIERSKQPFDPQPEVADSGEPVTTDVAPQVVSGATQSSGFVTWTLVAGIIITAMLLGVVLGRHVRMRKVMAKTPAASGVIDRSVSDQKPAAEAMNQTGSGTPAPASPAPQRNPLPPGSLVVYENGKQIFRASPEEKGAMTGSAEQPGGVEQASAVKKEHGGGLSPNATVLSRVNPVYPETARLQRIQGAVVLDVYIGRNGSVQGVQVVSGPPELSDASITAVKQWRFKPVTANGSPAEMQTRVTLNYVLPK